MDWGRLRPNGMRLAKSLMAEPQGSSLCAASRSLAISSTIVLVAPIPFASSSSMRATIASSSIFFSLLELSRQLHCASFPLHHSLSVVWGMLNAFDACFVLSGTVAWVALIARYSVPSICNDENSLCPEAVFEQQSERVVQRSSLISTRIAQRDTARALGLVRTRWSNKRPTKDPLDPTWRIQLKSGSVLRSAFRTKDQAMSAAVCGLRTHFRLHNRLAWQLCDLGLQLQLSASPRDRVRSACAPIALVDAEGHSEHAAKSQLGAVGGEWELGDA
ncbi:hypothetical protein BU25DRAFT_444083 [Macroventuria anomochaeta]|uniref:Uncharacterized protein n=1 Tax=Macroventuria anomochaeta TaxID=301207 RepID=A0ACB6SI90_9PLEO|nr:uncharacterized protein BU25DRAFT_444083 [Macroventuria anomochaeta]KAF2633295.1 hypothetical protein BU25DRAFT_444083 [Macroventuria anomochaeta]